MIAVRVTEVQEVSNVAVRKFGDDRCKGHGSSGRVERNAVRFRRVGGSHGRDRTDGRILKPALCQAGDNKNNVVASKQQ